MKLKFKTPPPFSVFENGGGREGVPPLPLILLVKNSSSQKSLQPTPADYISSAASVPSTKKQSPEPWKTLSCSNCSVTQGDYFIRTKPYL